MSGYSGYSMSNNAVDAYESGEKPRSKWTKKVLLSAIFSIEQMAVERRSLQTAFNESSVWTRRTTTRFRPSKHKKKTTLGGLFFYWDGSFGRTGTSSTPATFFMLLHLCSLSPMSFAIVFHVGVP